MSRLPFIIIIVAILGAAVAIGIGPASTEDWTNGGGKEAHKGWDFIGELTDTHYATSWISNMDSEDITFQMKIQQYDEWTWYEPDEIRYKAYLGSQLIDQWPSDGSWYDIPVVSDWPWDFSHKWHCGPSWTFNIQGEVVGKLKVVGEVEMDGAWWGDWEGEACWDGAYLESGRGEIYLYDDQGPFEEGSEAEIFVRTGFTNGAGWSVKLYPPPDRTDLAGLNGKVIDSISDDQQKIIYLPIETGWFKAGSTNEFRLELWNHLFDIGFTQVFTVDYLTRAPGEVIISSSWSGRTATFTLLAQSTYKPIEEFVVYAWYGDQTMPSMSDGESWVLYNEHHAAQQAAGNNYTATVTVTAKNKDGNIVFKAYAVDGDGRRGGPGITALVVEDGDFDHEENPIKQPFLWTWLVILLLIFGALIGFIAAYYVWLQESDWKMAMFAFFIVFGAFCVIAYVVGMTPSVAKMLGYLSMGVNC